MWWSAYMLSRLLLSVRLHEQSSPLCDSSPWRCLFIDLLAYDTLLIRATNDDATVHITLPCSSTKARTMSPFTHLTKSQWGSNQCPIWAILQVLVIFIMLQCLSGWFFTCLLNDELYCKRFRM